MCPYSNYKIYFFHDLSNIRYINLCLGSMEKFKTDIASSSLRGFYWFHNYVMNIFLYLRVKGRSTVVQSWHVIKMSLAIITLSNDVIIMLWMLSLTSTTVVQFEPVIKMSLGIIILSNDVITMSWMFLPQVKG